jgi:hypothetical protein
MTARIVKVESKRATWYEVQIRFLWVFWLDADIVRSGFPSVFIDFEEAMDKLNDLKPLKYKKSVQCTIKLS